MIRENVQRPTSNVQRPLEERGWQQAKERRFEIADSPKTAIANRRSLKLETESPFSVFAGD
jgi:hypothetical protein